MTDREAKQISAARDDFRRARALALREQIRGRLTGESADLLSFEDVRRRLGGTTSTRRGLQDIPLDSIVGSVGRSSDFTRSFLPRRAQDEDRWARVEAAMLRPAGVPPIDVYQIGDAYFVLDGNHRVSVARQLGATHIQANVTEVRTKVPLSPDDQPDDLVMKAEYAEFLELTHLDRLRPEADLSVSVPGQYPKLTEHISVHRYFMGIDQQREIPYLDAVEHWYDAVYLPVVQVIREQDLLRDFPDRTEADLYLWVSEHRAELQEELEWEVRPETAARDVAAESSPEATRVLARLSESLLEPLFGPAPGQWRQEQEVLRQTSAFTDILVPVSQRESTWIAVEQALEVLQHEQGRLLGIHVVPSEDERESAAVEKLESEFHRRCEAAGAVGTFVVEVGEIAPTICSRARWTSLIVVGLAHPPGDRPIDRLSSGFRWMIQHCPGPVLAVPEYAGTQGPSRLGSALLAYDGSPKANEALYLATYLARGWHMGLAVVSVDERAGRTALRDQVLARAQAYLEEHGARATFVSKQGPVAEAILATAEEQASELIMMGGYGFSPPMEIVFGSAVDQVLRESKWPVLICR